MYDFNTVQSRTETWGTKDTRKGRRRKSGRGKKKRRATKKELGTRGPNMSLVEENEVHSVGSMPPLTVRSGVEISHESSGESRSGAGSYKSVRGWFI